MELRAIFERMNQQYFEGILKEVKVRTYQRRNSSRLGFYKMQQGERSININIADRTGGEVRSGQDIKVTLLHEMIHAFLHIKGLPCGHTPRFKMMMRNLTEKEFGFRPTTNVRFHFALPSTPSIPTPQPTPAPAPQPVALSNRFRVTSMDKMGTAIRELYIYGRKHWVMSIDGMKCPILVPQEHAIPA